MHLTQKIHPCKQEPVQDESGHTDTRENSDADRGGEETTRPRAAPASQERSEVIHKERQGSELQTDPPLKLFQPVHKFVHSHICSLYVV
jgi:hypothetical protein